MVYVGDILVVGSCLCLGYKEVVQGRERSTQTQAVVRMSSRWQSGVR